MKRKSIAGEEFSFEPKEWLARGFATTDTIEETIAFLTDLCTPAELEALTDRFRVIPYLVEGLPYRDIYERTGVSVTTIGRVARTMSSGAGGYQLAVKRLKRRHHWPDNLLDPDAAALDAAQKKKSD